VDHSLRLLADRQAGKGARLVVDARQGASWAATLPMIGGRQACEAG